MSAVEALLAAVGQATAGVARDGIELRVAGRLDPDSVIVLPAGRRVPRLTADVVAEVEAAEEAARARAAEGLGIVERIEGLQRALAAAQLEVLAWMVDAAVTLVDPQPFVPGDTEGGTTAAVREVVRTTEREAANLVIDEVVTATGLPFGMVATRVRTALARGAAHQYVHDTLAQGVISSWWAERLITETEDLGEEARGQVIRDVLVPHHRDSGLPLSTGLLGRRLSKALNRYDADNRARKREERLARRDCRVYVHDDGTAQVVVEGTSPRAVAAADRVDALARHVRDALPTPQSGEPRKPSLGQLRADVALDLLLYGTIPGVPETVDENGEIRESTDQVTALVVGQDPPATVHLAISIDTLLNHPGQNEVGSAGEAPGDESSGSCDPGYLLGHGYLPADLARALAVSPGTIWRRL